MVGRQPSLSRGQLVTVSLELLQTAGVDAVTMRGLADQLGVKPASLYWHVRDRGELLDLLAEAVLAEVGLPGPGDGWRPAALGICAALGRTVGARRDSAAILMERLDVLARSGVHARLAEVLATAGLRPGVAQEIATMMLVHVIARSGDRRSAPGTGRARDVLVAVDSGSRGVTLRPGPTMSGLIRVAHDPAAAAPALVQEDVVTVRRRRGVGQGELELNPAYPWRFKVHGPTWNTVLDLPGLDVREIRLDGGAARVDCALPPPRGAVPITVAGGVVGVTLRRSPGVKVLAEVSAGALQLRLDDLTVGAATADLRWESAGPASDDHYVLRLSGGAARVTLSEDPAVLAPAAAVDTPADSDLTALDVLLDGVAAQLA